MNNYKCKREPSNKIDKIFSNNTISKNKYFKILMVS